MNDEKWIAAEPPEGFAARVVRIAESRRTSARPRRTKKVGALLLLAALSSGIAFGAYDGRRNEAPKARHVENRWTAPLREGKFLKFPRSAPARRVPLLSSPAEPPPARPRAAEPLAPPLVPPARPLRVPSPSCDCGPGANVCTCSP